MPSGHSTETTWSEIKPGDIVYHHRKKKRVISATLYDYNILDYGDSRPHVEVMFYDTCPVFSHTDGFYLILAKKKCRIVNSQ